MVSENTPSPTWKIVASWVVVGIPLIWGISQTFAKAMALFK